MEFDLLNSSIASIFEVQEGRSLFALSKGNPNRVISSSKSSTLYITAQLTGI